MPQKKRKKEGKKDETLQKCEQLNTAKAIWKIAKTELKDEDYKEFYKGFAHDNSEPLSWIHTKEQYV